jgi:hypothetical protein
MLIDALTSALTSTEYQSLEELIDIYREIDMAVGFPGDEGVKKSGKLPPILRVRDDTSILSAARSAVLAHFCRTEDNYFAVYNRDGPTSVELFYTGHGPNTLGAPMFPDLDAATLDTHGGPYNKSMRVALKVQLNPSARGLLIG